MMIVLLIHTTDTFKYLLKLSSLIVKFTLQTLKFQSSAARYDASTIRADQDWF